MPQARGRVRILSFRKEEGTQAVPGDSLCPREDRGAWVWLRDAALGTVSSNYLVKAVGHMGKTELLPFSGHRESQDRVWLSERSSLQETPGVPWGPPRGARPAQAGSFFAST